MVGWRWSGMTRSARERKPLPHRAPTKAPTRPATTITITAAGGCNRSEGSGFFTLAHNQQMGEETITKLRLCVLVCV